MCVVVFVCGTVVGLPCIYQCRMWNYLHCVASVSFFQEIGEYLTNPQYYCETHHQSTNQFKAHNRLNNYLKISSNWIIVQQKVSICKSQLLCQIPIACGISKNVCPVFNTNSTWYIYEGLSYVQYQHHVVYLRMFVLCSIPTSHGISKNVCPMFNTNTTWYI